MQIQNQMANVKMKCFSFWMNSQIYGQIPDFNKKISTVRSRRSCTNSYTSKLAASLKIDILMDYQMKL